RVPEPAGAGPCRLRPDVRTAASEQPGGSQMISNQVDPLGRARWEVLGLFADDDAARRATTWAREVLESASVDPSGQQLRALRALRRGSGEGAEDRAASDRSRAAARRRARRRSPLLE